MNRRLREVGWALVALAALPLSLLVMVRAALMFEEVSAAVLCWPCGHPEHVEWRAGFARAAAGKG